MLGKCEKLVEAPKEGGCDPKVLKQKIRKIEASRCEFADEFASSGGGLRQKTRKICALKSRVLRNLI